MAKEYYDGFSEQELKEYEEAEQVHAEAQIEEQIKMETASHLFDAMQHIGKEYQTKRLQLTMRPSLYNDVKREADRVNMSVNQFINNLLKLYVDYQESLTNHLNR